MPSTNSWAPDLAVFLFAFLTAYQIVSILVLPAHLKEVSTTQVFKYEVVYQSYYL